MAIVKVSGSGIASGEGEELGGVTVSPEEVEPGTGVITLGVGTAEVDDDGVAGVGGINSWGADVFVGVLVGVSIDAMSRPTRG